MNPTVMQAVRRAAASLGRLLLILLLGGAGGALLTWLGAPASWLSGAMIAVAAAALSGLPVAVPSRVRALAFTLLGISIGSAVTPETLVQVRTWPGSFSVLGVAIIAMMTASATYLARVRGWDRVTARFSSIPGAQSQVLILALRGGGDVPRIVLAQGVRLFVLAALLPWLIPGDTHPNHTAVMPLAHLSAMQSGVVLAASTAVGALMERLRVPGGWLVGAMIASGALHATGMVSGRLPQPLLIFGFITTGCVIGSRFVNMAFTLLRKTIRGALESVLLALAISALFTFAARHVLDLPFGLLWLAYAPGGVEAMTIMAFALGFDPAFVGAHHVVRLILLNIVVPFWLRNPRRLPARKETSPDSGPV